MCSVHGGTVSLTNVSSALSLLGPWNVASLRIPCSMKLSISTLNTCVIIENSQKTLTLRFVRAACTETEPRRALGAYEYFHGLSCWCWAVRTSNLSRSPRRGNVCCKPDHFLCCFESHSCIKLTKYSAYQHPSGTHVVYGCDRMASLSHFRIPAQGSVAC